jgi:hypothetical protein
MLWNRCLNMYEQDPNERKKTKRTRPSNGENGFPDVCCDSESRTSQPLLNWQGPAAGRLFPRMSQLLPAALYIICSSGGALGTHQAGHMVLTNISSNIARLPSDGVGATGFSWDQSRSAVSGETGKKLKEAKLKSPQINTGQRNGRLDVAGRLGGRRLGVIPGGLHNYMCSSF